MNIKRVKLNDYVLEKTIGQGSFGRVKLGREKESEKYVAVKMMQKQQIVKF